MNNYPVLLTDVDGVLLQWSTFFEEFLNNKVKTLGYEYIIDEQTRRLIFDKEKFMFIRDMVNCDQETELQWVREYNESDASSNMRAFDDAVECLEVLSNHFHIIAVTCIGRDSKVTRNRWKNLDDRFNKAIDEMYCIDIDESKEETFKRLKDKYGKRIVAYVDDREKHMLESQSVFGDDIVHFHMNRYSGEYADGCIPVDNWYEVSQELMGTGHVD